jgi:hypothetical protein
VAVNGEKDNSGVAGAAVVGTGAADGAVDWRAAADEVVVGRAAPAPACADGVLGSLQADTATANTVTTASGTRRRHGESRIMASHAGTDRSVRWPR